MQNWSRKHLVKYMPEQEKKALYRGNAGSATRKDTFIFQSRFHAPKRNPPFAIPWTLPQPHLMHKFCGFGVSQNIIHSKKFCSAKKREGETEHAEKSGQLNFLFRCNGACSRKRGREATSNPVTPTTLYTGCVRKRKKSQETREESRLCFVGSSGMDLLSPLFPPTPPELRQQRRQQRRRSIQQSNGISQLSSPLSPSFPLGHK